MTPTPERWEEKWKDELRQLLIAYSNDETGYYDNRIFDLIAKVAEESRREGIQAFVAWCHKDAEEWMKENPIGAALVSAALNLLDSWAEDYAALSPLDKETT